MMNFRWIRNFKNGWSTSMGEQSLIQMGNLMPGVYYRMELEPEFSPSYVGEGIFNLLGYKAKELLNKNTQSYLRLLHPEYQEILKAKKDSCLRSKEPKKLDYHLYTKSRKLKPVEDHFIGEYDRAGRLVAINGYFKEIKTASSKLQLLNQLEAYRAAIDVNIISSITDAKGIILYANDNFKRVSKYGDDELLGKSHRVVRSGHHPASFFKNMWETISSGRMWQGEILNRAKDGTLYWVATVIIPVFDEINNITSYLSLRTLITEQKRAEEQRERYIRVLEDIAHVVAHDIRGPICTIQGLVNIVKMSGCHDQDLKPTVGYLAYATKKLDDMTRELSAKIYSADVEMKSQPLNRAREMERSENES